MSRKIVLGILFLFLSLVPADRLALAEPKIDNATGADAGSTIRGLIDKYAQSITDADAKLGAEVWSTTPDVSFIHPLGTQHGWDEISTVMYAKIMGATFSKRNLKLTGQPIIQIYNDAAVVTFNWDFVAVFRSDGKPAHTTGRETQVYAKLPQRGWRLVHVHYSGPPTTIPGQGF